MENLTINLTHSKKYTATKTAGGFSVDYDGQNICNIEKKNGKIYMLFAEDIKKMYKLLFENAYLFSAERLQSFIDDKKIFAQLYIQTLRKFDAVNAV